MRSFLLLLCIVAAFPAAALLRKTTNNTGLVKDISLKKDQGTRYRISVAVKAMTTDTISGAMIATLQTRSSLSDFIQDGKGQAIADPRKNDWQELSMEGPLDAEAVHIWIMLITQGNGDFYFDNLRLKIYQAGKGWMDIPVSNGDFESSTEKNPAKGMERAASLKDKPGIKADLIHSADPLYGKSLHIRTSGGTTDTNIIYGYHPESGAYVNSKGGGAANASRST